jgi:hypothetical protein
VAQRPSPEPAAIATPVAAPVTPAPAAAGAFDPAGRWNLVFDIQGQNLAVTMELVKTPDGSWAGSLGSEMGTVAISKATLDGKKMSVTFAAPGGGDGSMLLLFDGNSVTGEWSAGGMGSKLSGSRH